MDRTDSNCISWWSSNETPLSPQAVFKWKSHTNNYRLPTVKLIFSKVPESSHWEPSICGAGSLHSAKVLQKVPRELKSSPRLNFSSAPLQLFLIIFGVFGETRNENRNLGYVLKFLRRSDNYPESIKFDLLLINNRLFTSESLTWCNW